MKLYEKYLDERRMPGGTYHIDKNTIETKIYEIGEILDFIDFMDKSKKKDTRKIRMILRDMEIGK